MGFFSHHESQNLNERSTEVCRPRSAITAMAAISSRFNPLRKLRVTSPPRNDPAIGFPEDHQFNRRLQEGSEGYVEQWTHTASKTIIAVKVVRHNHPYPNEVRILQHLPSHKSIVGYLGYCKRQPYAEKTSILLEYCSEGDLFTVRALAADKGRMVFSKAFMWSVYSQLMNAIAFLHEGIDDQHRRGRDEWRPIVHRDVKFENVLVKNLGFKDDWSDIEVKLGNSLHIRIAHEGIH
jgi:NIMA (never in mitosis gene a)-related kinase